MGKDNWFSDWLTESLSEKPKLDRQKFINLFVIELLSDENLDIYDIRDLTGPISGAHEHQLEENGKYSLFHMIGEEHYRKIKKPYERAVKKWNSQKNPPPYPKFEEPSSRSSIKELSMILENTLRTGIEFGIEKIKPPNLGE